jgi:hypothetical protein
VIGQFSTIPTRTHAELHATAAESVEAGYRLGGDGGIPLGYQAHGGADPHPCGHRRHGRQRHERIVGVGVPARRAAVVTTAAYRNVGVFGEEQRLEAMLLYRA